MTVSTVVAVTARAGFVEGMAGRTLLEGFCDNLGGTYEDFEADDFPDRFLDTELAGIGVTIATVENIFGDPIADHSVYIASSADTRLDDSIAGRPTSSSISEDGRNAYEIRFTTPVRYAGVERNWNDLAWTEFYDAQGSMLIRAPVTDFPSFHAWVADSNDPNTWVSYIKVGGDFPFFPNTETIDIASRQVGYTDDLFFGVAIPEPATLLYIAAGTGAISLIRLRRRTKDQRLDA